MKNYNIFISLLCAFATLVVSSAHHDRAVHVHAARDVNGGMNTQVVNSVTRGVKAGLSGYQGIQQKQAFSQLTPHISWYSDYQATTPDVGNVAGVPMLWGDASSCGSIGQGRLSAFNNGPAKTPPKIMFGFYEPDCQCSSSSQMTVADSIDSWNTLLAPLASHGTILGSPSACKQADETWLQEFSGKSTKSDSTYGSNQGKTLTASWNVTSVHINKNSLAEVQQDIDYYARTYGKPLWVSEFACVDDKNGFTPCSDQTQINQFVKDVVNFFHCNETVVAYGASNGEGLGNAWPLIGSDGGLSQTGNAYLSALQSFTSAPNQCS